MTIKRLDHVSVVVDDLAAAIAFFTALGMTIEGEMPVEGPWVDRVTVARLRATGAELIGEVAQYEDIYRLCYMRGPAGIIVALAEELLKRSPPSEKPVAP